MQGRKGGKLRTRERLFIFCSVFVFLKAHAGHAVTEMDEKLARDWEEDRPHRLGKEKEKKINLGEKGFAEGIGGLFTNASDAGGLPYKELNPKLAMHRGPVLELKRRRGQRKMIQHAPLKRRKTERGCFPSDRAGN